MDSFNPYGQNPQPNPRPGQAAASGYVHIGGGRYVQSSASTGTPSAAPTGFDGRASTASTPSTGLRTVFAHPGYTPSGTSTNTAGSTPMAIPMGQPDSLNVYTQPHASSGPGTAVYRLYK